MFSKIASDPAVNMEEVTKLLQKAMGIYHNDGAACQMYACISTALSILTEGSESNALHEVRFEKHVLAESWENLL